MKPTDEEVYQDYLKMCRTLKAKPASFEAWKKMNAGIKPWVNESFQVIESRNPRRRGKIGN